MPITTTPSEHIGLCTRMRRFLVRFIRPEAFVHTRSLVDFITTTSESRFSVHTTVSHGFLWRARRDSNSRPSDSKTEGMQIRQSSFCWHELGTGFDRSTQSFNPYKSDRMD